MTRFSQWGSLFTSTRGAGLALASGFLLLGLGCAVENGADEKALSSPEGDQAALEDLELPVPFASFATDDGGTVQFFEPEPGELLVTSVSKIDSGAPLDEKLPAALYEELAGEPLPERFVAALAHGDRAAEEEAVEASLAESGGPDFSAATDREVQGLTKMNVTTEQFATTYCEAFRPLWCWLNRTDTSHFSQRRDSMGTYAYVYRGSVQHRLRRKNTWGKWKTLYSVTVPAGYISTTFNFSGIAYTHESRVDEASGDGYHHSGYYI